MTFTDMVKTIAELIAELNKNESNAQQKQFLATLRLLERQIKKQDTTAKRHLVIGIVVSAIVSWLLGHFFR